MFGSGSVVVFYVCHCKLSNYFDKDVSVYCFTLCSYFICIQKVKPL